MAKKLPLRIEITARDKFSKKLAVASRKIKTFGKNLGSFGSNMATSLTLPTAFAGAAIIKTGADFELAMNRVRAVSGLLGKQNEKTFGDMRELAKKMGSETQFSATQAAQGMNFLAMAGFSASQIMKALPGTLDLAAVAQIELGEAADIASNILTGYGKDVEDLNDVNNVLTATFTKSNTSLVELGEAFKIVGPIAGAMNIPIEETAALLGSLANAGFKATLSGTALKRSMALLVNPTSKALETFKKLGIDHQQFIDAEGNLKSLTDVIEALQFAGANTADMFTIFGDRGGPAMTALMAQGSDAVNTLRKDIAKAGNITKQVADVMKSGAAGAMFELKSAAEGLMIAIGESGLLRAFTENAKKLSGFIRGLIKTNPETFKLATTIALVTVAIGPLVIGTGLLISSFGALLTAANLIIVKFGAFVIMKTVALAIGAVSLAVNLLTASFAAIGLLGPIAIISALAIAGMLLWKNWDFVIEKLGGLFTWFKDIVIDSLSFVFKGLDKLFGIGDKIKSLGGLIGGLSSFIFGESEKQEQKPAPFLGGGVGVGAAEGPGVGFRPSDIITQQQIIQQKIIEKKQEGEITVKFPNMPKGTRVDTKAKFIDLKTVVAMEAGPIMAN